MILLNTHDLDDHWGGPEGRGSCIASYSSYPSNGFGDNMAAPISSPSVRDQPGKDLLKFAAMAGNWTRARERTDSEIILNVF